MANQQQLNRLLSGVQNWNAWREIHSDEVPDFSEANLEKLYLVGVNLRRTYCEHPYGSSKLKRTLPKPVSPGQILRALTSPGQILPVLTSPEQINQC